MDVVRRLAKQAEYRKPGEPAIELDWLPGFRFYVLGPPTDLDAIHDTGEHGSSELYALTALTSAALLQAGACRQRRRAAERRHSTFASAGKRRSAHRRTHSARPTLRPPQSWRSIDADWLNVASSLAIQLDKFTNNTSLVIAIERIADGKVLLFPGDAQEGNWLSWHDPSIKWEVKGTGRQGCDRHRERPAGAHGVLQGRTSLQPQRDRQGQGAGDDDPASTNSPRSSRSIARSRWDAVPQAPGRCRPANCIAGCWTSARDAWCAPISDGPPT